MANSYGEKPRDLGLYPVDTDEVEVHAYLYMPIKMADSRSVRYPRNMAWAFDMIFDVAHGQFVSDDHYVYLTSKKVFVQPGYSGNRPGWHGDGFGTDDLNFIWYDRDPTRICVQPFHLADDHVESMRQMTEQVDERNVVYYPNQHLLLLDQNVIHTAPVIAAPGFRTFLKLSVSRHKYNLAGNSHNHEFNYDWEMHDRDAQRNDPIYGETDFVPE